MPNVALHLGDAVKWAQDYKGDPFHALFCDPPYHLSDMSSRYGRTDKSPGPFKRSHKGFMGKQWDGGDLAFNPETWEAFKSIMYPGAFGMAFSGSRGWHRQAVAIEDAGFVIHPTIFGWCYGSGFPKATRVKENTVFSGHRYGLQALKPALEPIIVFQKPYEGKPVDNITETGAGALWVDGGRIGINEELPNYTPSKSGLGKHGIYGESTREQGANSPTRYDPSGRWPSNFYLDAEAARRLDEQSGEIKGVKRKPTGNAIYPTDGGSVKWNANNVVDNTERGYSDSGGASRFFYTVREQIDDADPVRYVAKASRKERDSGLDSCEIVMIELHQNKHSNNEVQSWENLDQKVKLLVATEHLAPKVIDVSCTTDVTAWNTLLFGNSTTGQFPMEGKSITVTETNLITGSKTLSWWMHSLTNVYTADASSSTANGGSPAESAENYSPSVSFINVETVSLPGVGIVPSGTQWTISASGALGLQDKHDRMGGTSAHGNHNPVCVNCGGSKIDRGSGVCACDKPEWKAINNPTRNTHPTIKPLALTRYLATLLLPPAEYAPRRLFVPFAGVASECIGAMQAGWDEVVGVEITEEYLPIAQARVDYWKEKEHA